MFLNITVPGRNETNPDLALEGQTIHKVISMISIPSLPSLSGLSKNKNKNTPKLYKVASFNKIFWF